jgi:hypothetical protein
MKCPLCPSFFFFLFFIIIYSYFPILFSFSFPSFFISLFLRFISTATSLSMGPVGYLTTSKKTHAISSNPIPLDPAGATFVPSSAPIAPPPILHTGTLPRHLRPPPPHCPRLRAPLPRGAPLLALEAPRAELLCAAAPTPMPARR